MTDGTASRGWGSCSACQASDDRVYVRREFSGQFDGFAERCVLVPRPRAVRLLRLDEPVTHSNRPRAVLGIPSVLVEQRRAPAALADLGVVELPRRALHREGHVVARERCIARSRVHHVQPAEERRGDAADRPALLAGRLRLDGEPRRLVGPAGDERLPLTRPRVVQPVGQLTLRPPNPARERRAPPGPRPDGRERYKPAHSRRRTECPLRRPECRPPPRRS